MSLIQELAKKGVLPQEKATQLEYEINKSGEKEEQVIMDKGLVSEEIVFETKSEYLGVPLKKDVEDISPEILKLIPEETAVYYKMVPLGEGKGNLLDVGMIYPEDLKAQEALSFLSREKKFNSQIFLISFSVFNKVSNQYKNFKKEVRSALDDLRNELDDKESPSGRDVETEAISEDAPITKIVAVILRHAVEGGASDIHIEPTKEQLRVRFRFIGVLHSSIFLPIKIAPAVVARIKILSGLKLDETRIPQDGRFSTKIGNRNVDFRVSTFPTTLGEKVVIRVLDSTMGLKKIDDLGMEGRNKRIFESSIKKPYGLILVVGPTGSGKSTTIYAILNALNKDSVNIVTLEDPAEYFIEGVNQSQIRPEIGYSFGSGLRHILRQDPNIIMIGEIRDGETASLAMNASLTGHLVLSTLHTSGALSALPRLFDLGVESYLIAPTLNCIISQRLIRVLCNDCKKKSVLNKQTMEILLKEIGNMPPSAKKDIDVASLKIFEPVGCKKCNDTGFSGRIAIYEILEMTKELANIDLKNFDSIKLEEEAKRQEMTTMKQDGILKVLKGIVSIEEVLRVTKEQ